MFFGSERTGHFLMAVLTENPIRHTKNRGNIMFTTRMQ